MARPTSDIETVRALLLDKLHDLIQRRGAASASLTELAREAGMSPANIYRFFPSKEALYEASAERWFAPKIAIMEEVVESDLSGGEKLYEFFARRFRIMRANYNDDPALFESYLDLGDEHEDIVRGYIDLGDHYLAMIVAECMAEGHFGGLSVDQAVSLINLMILPFCSPRNMMLLAHSVTEEKLAFIVNAILGGLRSKPAVALVPAARAA